MFKRVHSKSIGQYLLGAISMALLLTTLSANGADDAAEYQKKLEALRENIEKLKSELDSVKSQRGQLQQELEASESEIGELEDKVDTLNEKIEQQDEELQSLQQQQRQLDRERNAQRQQIAAQIQSAYRAGPQSPLKMLLGQDSPERITRLNKYHDYLLAARNEKLKHYRTTLSQLDALEPQLVSARKTLNQRRQDLSLRQRELIKQQEKRSSTLEKLAAVIASKDAQLAAEREDSQRLGALLAEMSATLGSTNPPGTRFSRLQGKLPWPTEGQVRHRYGSSRVGNQLSWEGVMIQAQAGTPVIAVHAGQVIFAEYLRGQGLLIIVDHGEGYMSLYAHNQTLLKRPGDRVDAGDIIARVGNSGGQSYSGLYFEIRHEGRPTNPGPWLARA